MIETFAALCLHAPLVRALAEEDYLRPTPIQGAAIPPALAGRDVLGCAQTGTGKTAAFALPILHRLDQHRQAAVPRAPRVLVLAPTRELAAQIADSFETYGRYVAVRQAVVVGGVNQNPQIKALARGVHILVATPGRLMDLMEQGHVKLSEISMLVVDEADRMLDMGFLPALRKIVAALPKQRQSLFFSATMPDGVAALARSLLRDPARVTVAPPASPLDSIEQRVLFVDQAEKRHLLVQLLKDGALHQVLVFTRTKRRAETLARQLRAAKINADAIHGNKSQNARQRALLQFRNGRTRVLVATDVAARGLDVDGITHVINHDLPDDPDNYIHRIGRTGRAGASGIALTFCDAAERDSLRAIERLIRQSIPVDAVRWLPAAVTVPPVQQSTRPTPAEAGRSRRGRSRRRPHIVKSA
jgi:ATP-dependent RNA helicase RhlE